MTDDIDLDRAHGLVSGACTGTATATPPAAVAPTGGGIVVTTRRARSSPSAVRAGPPPPSLPVPATLGASGRPPGPGTAGEPVVARELLNQKPDARMSPQSDHQYATARWRGAATRPIENEEQRKWNGGDPHAY